MRNNALRFLSLLMTVAFVVVSCMTCVFADTTGSITVVMKYDNTIIRTGTLTIYKVADANGNFTTDFAGCGLDITNEDDTTLTWLLWSWAQQVGATDSSATVDATSGTVVYSGLDTGYYLIVPTVNPTGYVMTPSLVSIPLKGEYDISIEPKIDPTTTPPDTPDEPTTTTTVTQPDEEVTTAGSGGEEGNSDDEPDVDIEEKEPEKDEDTLPQTGQLNYPIPIMAGAGAICVAAGLIVTRSDKKK